MFYPARFFFLSSLRMIVGVLWKRENSCQRVEQVVEIKNRKVLRVGWREGPYAQIRKGAILFFIVELLMQVGFVALCLMNVTL